MNDETARAYIRYESALETVGKILDSIKPTLLLIPYSHQLGVITYDEAVDLKNHIDNSVRLLRTVLEEKLAVFMALKDAEEE
jgi:hypothetical protein